MILTGEKLEKTYTISRGLSAKAHVRALRGVSLHLNAGETLAVVGESGCGKSTLARLLMGLEKSSSGSIHYQGRELSRFNQRDLSNHIQMIFQDPHSSLNPRWSVAAAIGEPLAIRGVSKDKISERVQEVAQLVGLRPEWLKRFPHMLSGGQKQRVGIARALITTPKILICDEPVSALDVSVQAQVLNLLLDLKSKLGLSLIFISHDLHVVRFIADRIAILYLGQVVEQGETEAVFKNPQHPYTQLLLASAPHVDATEVRQVFNAGEIPSPMNPPKGCGFSTRCLMVKDRCRQEAPQLESRNGADVACFERPMPL